MAKKRLWIALVGIPISLASLLVIGAQKSNLANARGVIDPTCTSTSPCIEYDNTSSGPGIRGVSFLGNGVNGQTKFNSTSSSNGKTGIFGNDVSTSGSFNIGVKGLSVRGTGVYGVSTSGAGVSGTSTSDIGVQGTTPGNAATNAGVGVAGNSTYGVGVAGSSTNHTGVEGSGAEIGVQGESSSGTGVLGQSFDSWAVRGVSGGSTSPTGQFENTNASGFSFEAFNSVTLADMFFDASGNLHITGEIFTGGSCSKGCVVTQSTTGQKVTSYSARGSVPSIEDFGEGRLVNGVGHVAIAPDFASLMAPRATYLVFLTPEGDNRGLYVSNKTSAGFTVLESQGGHSTLVFDYRIVAKPFGDNNARLPLYHPARVRLVNGYPAHPRTL